MRQLGQLVLELIAVDGMHEIGPRQLVIKMMLEELPQVGHGDHQIGLMSDHGQLGDQLAAKDSGEAGALAHVVSFAWSRLYRPLPG